jgi:hypothetical protein
MEFLLNFPFLGKTKLKSLTFSYCFEVLYLLHFEGFVKMHVGCRAVSFSF